MQVAAEPVVLVGMGHLTVTHQFGADHTKSVPATINVIAEQTITLRSRRPFKAGPRARLAGTRRARLAARCVRNSGMQLLRIICHGQIRNVNLPAMYAVAQMGSGTGPRTG